MSANQGRCTDPSGHGTGKKIDGKKRHVLVDTQGLLIQAVVHATKVQTPVVAYC